MKERFGNCPHGLSLDIRNKDCCLICISPIRQALAKYAHDSWSGWMRYLFSKATLNDDGTITIPRLAVERWTRQMKTGYTDLPNNEKTSDLDEADCMLNIMYENKFFNELAKKQKPLEPEYQKILDDNLWEMLG